jgi:hypothetical protein
MASSTGTGAAVFATSPTITTPTINTITSPAATALALQSAGTTAIYVDTSQNVGINATPTAQLQVFAQESVSGKAIRAAYNATYYTDYTETGLNCYNNDYWIKTKTAGTNLIFYTANTERMRIDSSGNVSISQTPGKYTIDTTINGVGTSIANGGTVDFSAASGMLIVNNWSTGGVTIYICGGGATVNVGSVSGTVGTFSYQASVNGYRWTNNYGSTATFGFFFVRTRSGA